MPAYLYLALMVIAASQLQAQDTLYKVDGSKAIAKILEINEVQVKYKLFSNQEGPTYVISKDHVLKIVYATGQIEVFPGKVSDNTMPVQNADPRITDFGRNFISVDVFDLFAGALTIGYEYIFKSGLSSLKVPLSIGIIERDSYRQTKTFGTGLDYSFYPYGQGRFTFFYGPSFEYKRFKLSYYDNESNSSYALLGQIGLLFQPEKHFNISFTLGLGYARIIEKDPYYNHNYGQMVARAGLNIGYKF